jgi:hypothetical protein
VTGLLQAEPDLGIRVPTFTSRRHERFVVEFAIIDSDLVFHFKLPPDKEAQLLESNFWRQTFPEVLSALAQAYFKATYPRLKAAYTEEVNSWWMRAYGFADVPDPIGRADGFLRDLSLALMNTRDK